MDQVTKEVFALKQMQKARIVKTGQQRNVCNEKRLLRHSKDTMTSVDFCRPALILVVHSC